MGDGEGAATGQGGILGARSGPGALKSADRVSEPRPPHRAAQDAPPVAGALVLTLPLPDPLMSINAMKGMHWSTKGRHMRVQRQAAGWAAVTEISKYENIGIRGEWPNGGCVFPVGRVVVDVEIRPRKGQKRPDDTAIWEAMKPLWDGLEDARIVADDKQFVVGALSWSSERTSEIVLTLTQQEGGA